jgi:hypothetical protein
MNGVSYSSLRELPQSDLRNDFRHKRYEKASFHDKMSLTKNYIRKKGDLLMENIIQQIVAETAINLINYFKVNGLGTLDKMTDDLKSISDDMVSRALAAYIESTDKSICDAKDERKQCGITVHQRNVSRTLFTAIGNFTYGRTYFDTECGKAYLLDDILGVDPYERIDAGVSARLVNAAASHSYGRSASIVTGGNISKQSAWNKAMNTGEVAYVPERVECTPASLHIFADEDHVSLQDGRNTIVPLVTVSAGKRPVSKGRNALIEPFHVQGYGMDKETLWGYVYALCAEKFDMDLVDNVFIYGDGAAWIKGGMDVFSNAVYSLDTFHFRKRMRSLFSGQIGSKFALKAFAAVSSDNKISFEETARAVRSALLDTMPEGKEKERKTERIDDNIGYILNNWDGIQNSRLPGVIGSCTEAMVSHVLSERLSRNPMGWSKKGLSKMAMIRVYVQNGCEITPADTISWKHSDKRNRIADKIAMYDDIVKRHHEEIFKDVKSWRWFETDSKISGKTTGTKVALDALGKFRNVS